MLEGHEIMDLKQDAERSELLRIASADMARLAERSGEAVALAAMVGSEAIHIGEIDRPEARGARRRIDRRVPLWRSAIGKALARIGIGADEMTLAGFVAGMPASFIAK